MAEPWPVKASDIGPGWFEVTDDANFSCWPTEKLARRYAALPVLIAAIRKGLNSNGKRYLMCGFCDVYDGHTKDCDGIAALKAAGEEIE